MSSVTVLYPHQLYKDVPSQVVSAVVYLVEEPLFFKENPAHRQRLLLHRLSMRAYAARLEQAGCQVVYFDSDYMKDTATVYEYAAEQGVERVCTIDPTDTYLTQRIARACARLELELVVEESLLFIMSKEDAVQLYQNSNKHLAKFYQQLRQDKNILLDSDGKPIGGKWSFDADNRKKIPQGMEIPAEPEFYQNTDTKQAEEWLTTQSGELYGESGVWLPYTHELAEEWLEKFLVERLHNFGPYEDAITSDDTRLFHSVLSPLINIGLLSPQQVIERVCEYGLAHEVPIASLEGFVRQVLGWREFIRASYECDGSKMRTNNFWKHDRVIPDSFWKAASGIQPFDDSVSRALQYGYTHHIERLMIQGNVLLLCNIDPDQVYRWFMGLYVDAYDWVMVPNVYGMSQFSDGGIFATKPYISGSNYIKKMSNYPAGEWEDIWTALYWNFIAAHSDFFTSNHRLSMMPRMWDKFPQEKKTYYLHKAEEFFAKNLSV